MDTISDCVIKHELDQMNLYFLLDYFVQSKTMGNIKLCIYIAVLTKVVPQSVKAYATMPNGIMGSKILALLD